MSNDINSNNPNPKDLLEMANLQDKLQWYKKFRMESLPERFRFMADYSIEEIDRWDRDKRRGTVRILDNVKN
jgi:hypothetical protein